MRYKHTQIGWVMLVCCAAGVALILAIERSLPPHAQRQVPSLFLAAIIVAVMSLFATLTVEVDSQLVRLSFGPGLIRKSFPLVDVADCRPVRNRWWMGWGIHGTPGRGWLFNVSGFDAVELTMKNGKIYRIGTDDPQKLNDAIQMNLPKS